ncbi:MAG: polysaccharide biosynthesis/export family protein, partial [Deltaproteobacteria bacterium]
MRSMANGMGKWMKRLVSLAISTAVWRRRLATCMLLGSVLIPSVAGVGCREMMSANAVPTEASVSKPSGNLAPGDVINVIFSGAPELSTKQKIQPNGKVSLPTLGDVSAAGKTIAGLQQQLSTLYQPHLQDSTVVVSLSGTAAGVYVSGEVLRPGKIPLERPMTALEAVMEAGGFTKLANPKQVFILRNQ